MMTCYQIHTYSTFMRSLSLERNKKKMMKQSSEKATRAWVLALTSVASFMVGLDALVVATALSTIRLHLGASIEELEWTVNAYTLSFAVLLMTGSALGDRFGRRRLFVVGLELFVTGAALGVVWGLVRGNQVGWSSVEVVTTLVAGFGLAVVFVAWERRARVPMLPLRFFRSRAFSAGNAAGFLYFASLYGSAFFLAQFLQTALGYGPLGAGLRLLPWTAMLFVSAPLAGVLVNRFGERTLMVGGLLLQAGAFAWIGLIARPGLAYPELVAPLIIAAVFAGVGSFGSAQAFSNGFAPAMGVSAALSLVGAIAGLLLPGRRDMAFVRTTTQAPGTREHEPYGLPEQSPSR